MKKELTFDEFVDEFQAIRPDNFSYEGLKALYDYFEDFDPDYCLDVIAVFCEFTEYDNIHEYNKDYGKKYKDYWDINETTVLSINGESFIIENY